MLPLWYYTSQLLFFRIAQKQKLADKIAKRYSGVKAARHGIAPVSAAATIKISPKNSTDSKMEDKINEQQCVLCSVSNLDIFNV